MTAGGSTMRRGALAEFATPAAMTGAVRALLAQGFREVEYFAPYDVPEARGVVPRRRSRLGWITAAAVAAGFAAGYLVQLYANVWHYPLNAGGRPFHAVPMFLLAAFATALLLGAVAITASLLWGLRLPQLWHPVFEVEGFGRATDDRFWVVIDGRDPRYDPARSSAALQTLGPLRVVVLEVES